MKKIFFASLFLSILFIAASSTAQPIHDTFWSNWESTGFVAGGGTGWDEGGNGEGDWILYPSGWRNQWFYNDPPDPQRWKIIDYRILIEPMAPEPMPDYEIAINWSTLDFESGPDGAPPMQDDFIVRDIVFSGPVTEFHEITGQIIIDDYNPEWVSIDIRPLNSLGITPLNGGGGGGYVSIDGDIWHECIPEPATLCFLGLGGLNLLRKRRV